MATGIAQEILDWSNGRPGWQRDALRRLFTTGEIGDTDLTELVDLCKSPRGLSNPRTPRVLSTQHIATANESATPVSLVSVTHHRGVNALAPDQTVTFGPNLTVVYGQNAAGKSGYTRILKRACRSRFVEEILGNVLSNDAPLAAQATITFRDGTQDLPLEWTPNGNPSDTLAAVSVFDSRCVPAYLQDKTDVAFRPFGLDIFDKLATVCNQVRTALDKELAVLKRTIPSLPAFPESTRANALIMNLTSLTKVDDVRDLATLCKEEKRRLKDLRAQQKDLQADDPKQRAKDLTLKASRIDLVVNHLANLAGIFDDAGVGSLRSAAESLRLTRLALATLRKTAVTSDLLAGTGEEEWRAMWDTASTFVETAFPNHTFPILGKGAKCPLCQQTLQTEASERLRRLAAYISSDAQAKVREAETAYERTLSSLTEASIDRPDVDLALTELSTDAPELADQARQYLNGAVEIQQSVKNAVAQRQKLPKEGIAMDMGNELRSAARGLRDRAARLQKQSSALDPKDALELTELESRELLTGHLQAVEGEIDRLKQIAAYGHCLDDTSTQPITRKSTELTKRLVTDQLQKAFHDELSKLGFTHLSVGIEPAGGTKGALFHRLVFTNAPGVTVTKVLSEGESRALSLASFLTELSTAPAKSAIIFDDPVSSLDHIWRERIAIRLVSEAQTRQVIVFTHDLLFLRVLLDNATRLGLPIAHQYIHRNGQAGVCAPDLPWVAMNVKARIGWLRNRWVAAEKAFRTAGSTAYESEAREIYGRLREAWEHAIGEVLLNDVVERYRPSIETKRLRDLHDITKEDCKTVEDAMTEASRWIWGHDQPPADGTPFPKPEDLKQRIDDLEAWAEAIRKRRK